MMPSAGVLSVSGFHNFAQGHLVSDIDMTVYNKHLVVYKKKNYFIPWQLLWLCIQIYKYYLITLPNIT